MAGDIATIIEQSRNGDTAAFARFVRQYQSQVSGVIYSVVGDFHLSEDIAQETFLIAWSKLADLKNTGDPLPWLCTIARNLAKRSFRKKRETTSEIPTDQAVSNQPDPADEIARKEQSEFVWAAIREIPEKYRETLVLYYRNDKSVREIAAATDSSIDAVNQRLVRARQSLKSKLESMIGDILSASSPGEAFTLGVLAALPGFFVSTTTAQAATTIATTVGTSGVAKKTTAITACGSSWMLSSLWVFAFAFLAQLICVRNAPTLRSRRFTVYSFFWICQYYVLFFLLLGIAFFCVMMLPRLIPPLAEMLPHPTVYAVWIAVAFIIATIACVVFPLIIAGHIKYRAIIENDLQLTDSHVPPYSYNDLKRCLFRSVFVNILVIETIIGLAVFHFRYFGLEISYVLILARTMLAGLILYAYYRFGKYLLEISRDQLAYDAAAPLVEKPFEVALSRCKVERKATDKDRLGFYANVWVYCTFAVYSFFYFLLLGDVSGNRTIMVACFIAITAILVVFVAIETIVKDTKIKTRCCGLCLLIVAGLLFILEYAGCASFSLEMIRRKLGEINPEGGVHFFNLFLCCLAFFFGLVLLFGKNDRKKSEQDQLYDMRLHEAIERYDPTKREFFEPDSKPMVFSRIWICICVCFCVVYMIAILFAILRIV